MFDDGGGGENCGLTPTEEVPWLLEEMLAKHSVPSFVSTTVKEDVTEKMAL